MELNTAIRLCVNIALENLPSLKVKTIEFLNEECNGEIPPISTFIANTLRDIPLIQVPIMIELVIKKNKLGISCESHKYYRLTLTSSRILNLKC